jgi:hypothetical protein
MAVVEVLKDKGFITDDEILAKRNELSESTKRSSSRSEKESNS